MNTKQVVPDSEVNTLREIRDAEPEPEFTRLWTPPDTVGVELFKARLFRHTFGKHMHEAYTIGLNEGGQGAFLYRGETWRTSPGVLVLLNPGEVHTGQPVAKAGWIYRDIYLDFSLVEELLAQLAWPGQGLPYFPEAVVQDELLYRILSRLFQALNRAAPRLERDSLLLWAVSTLITRHADEHHPLRPGRQEPAAVALVRAYLEVHYSEEISIGELAGLAGLSPYYLIRSFQQQLGLPPHGYQRHLRLLKAKQALHTATPLAEVALAHGFYDQSHLNRHFKRAFGVTPGHYRQSNSIQDLPTALPL